MLSRFYRQELGDCGELAVDHVQRGGLREFSKFGDLSEPEIPNRCERQYLFADQSAGSVCVRVGVIGDGKHAVYCHGRYGIAVPGVWGAELIRADARNVVSDLLVAEHGVRIGRTARSGSTAAPSEEWLSKG